MKVPHKFIVSPLPKWAEFDYTIAYKIRWNGQQWGHYALMLDSDTNHWRHMRELVKHKRELIEDLKWLAAQNK